MVGKINVDKIVQTYKTLTQIPALTGGNIYSSNVINSVWSQRNLEKGKTTKFQKNIVIQNLKRIDEVAPVDISNELASRDSHSKKFRAVLRENDSKQYLEVWQNHNLIRTVDIAALDMHGSVYSDTELSSFEWSPDEKKLLYVAEKKPPKTEPFYQRKGKTDENGDSKQPAKGEQYLFEQDWGEQLVGKKQSIIAQYDVENDKVEILEGLPEKGVCIAQPKYSPDGSHIIGIAYYTEPRKFGLIYCTNRPSTVFKLDFNANYLELALKDVSIKSPIFSPDGQYVLWLQRNAGGPHHTCMSLVKAKAPLTENSEIKVIVDAVPDKIEIQGGKTFYGLYNTGFPKRCWASENRLLVNTNQKYTINSYVINIENGTISELEYSEGSQIVVDVSDDTVLAVRRNFLIPDKLVLGKIEKDNSISWNEITSSTVVEGLDNCIYKYLDLAAEKGDVKNFNAIYVGPKSGEHQSVPLVVWPHGGPHSAFANQLMLEIATFLTFGYAVLLINYRGSVGSGENSVNFLLGKVGAADVEDCVQSTDYALKEFPWLNPNALALSGGSHGGFLVTHLSGQYPTKFKAVVARNPVIDIASMSIISDIPDWCYVEAGDNYTQRGVIDNELLLKMRKASPIEHAHKVRAPTLLQIGSKDLRVPPHQGNEYYHRLKANGVKTRMNLYDDNHPLGAVGNEVDNIINCLLWIDEHVN